MWDRITNSGHLWPDPALSKVKFFHRLMPTSSGSMILTIKLTQQQQNERKRYKNSLIMLCVYTQDCVYDKNNIGFQPLRCNNHSQQEGNWMWDIEANMMKWWGEGYYISTTGLYLSQELGFGKLLMPAGESGRSKFLFSASQTQPIERGGKQCAQPLSPSGGLFSNSPL